MSTTRQLLLDSNNPVAALINSDFQPSGSPLASNGVILAATAFSNKQADSAGLGYAYCRAVLGLGGPSSAWTAGSAMYVWFLTEDDGANYATAAATSGTSSTPPCSRAPDLIFPLENNTSAQIITAEGAVPNCAVQKALLWNNGGQAVKATGDTLNLYFYTDQNN
jgi:hypothetical protein